MAVTGNLLSPQESQNRRRAALISLTIGLLLMAFKFWAHFITGSQMVFSDALESIVNVVAAAMAFWVVQFASQPADRNHPYGHGKMEYFSAAFEGGLISFAGFFIVIEAVRSYFGETELRNLDQGIWMTAAAGIGNLILGLYLLRQGKRGSSIALRSSGHHVISDFWTSVGVVAGLLIVQWTGWSWVDPALAVVVGILLTKQGARIVRGSVSGLLDEEDTEVLTALAEAFRRHARDGIIQLHHVKVIRSGWYHHIDAHIVIPEFWDVETAHRKINEFEKNVIRAYEYGGELNYHLDPCRRAYCRVCDIADCPVRAEKFERRLPVIMDHLRSPVEPAEFAAD